MSTSTTCPYSVLGVARMASMEDVKRAYRAQVKKYHPDVNPGNTHAASMFRIVQDAYERIERGDHGSTSSPKTPRAREMREYHHVINMRQSYTGFYANLEGRVVFILPGVANGDTLTIGDDVSCLFTVKPDAKEKDYYRVDDDLYCRTPHRISRRQARNVGGFLYIPHPFQSQKMMVSVSRRIEEGDAITIYGKGFCDYNSQKRGDYVVKLEIEPMISLNPVNAIKRYFDWMLTLPPSKLLFQVTLMVTLPLLSAMIVALVTAP